jgi:hypothetical protein
MSGGTKFTTVRGLVARVVVGGGAGGLGLMWVGEMFVVVRGGLWRGVWGWGPGSEGSGWGGVLRVRD